MKYLLFGLICSVLIVSCKQDPKPAKNEETPENTFIYADSVTIKLDSLYSLGPINGFGTAIADENGILYAKGFGSMDLEAQKPYTEHTVQNIASISKTFIGISLMKAQELGMLNLDDPVNKYLPFELVNPHFPKDTIRIRQLTNHTAGIVDTDVYDQKSYVLKESVPDSLLSRVEETLNPPETKVSILEFLPEVLEKGGKYYSEDVFLDKKPGSTFEYSNIGATLAALVLEMASEVPFDRFTEEHILKPLKMADSGWSYDRIDFEMHTKLYAAEQKQIPFYELITYPDGGLRASTHDMALYLSEMIRGNKGNGSLLTKESYSEYFRPTLEDSHFEERDAEFPYNDEYDMGVFMAHSGTGLIGHTGGDPGTSTFMFFNPETEIGLYLMINTSIVDEEGVQQLFGMMGVLEEFATKAAE